MTFAEIAMWVSLLTPASFMLMVLLSKSEPTMGRLFTALANMLTRVWESIMILAGKQPAVVEGNQKLTLDEMGITLEEASDAHYDEAPLKRIQALHSNEHSRWQTQFDRLLPPADLDDTEDIWDEDADETLLMIECKNHSKTETCYYCDGDPVTGRKYRPKRQRRKR